MELKRSQSWMTALVLNVAVALAYFVAGKLGLLLAIPPGYATVVWPPSGIALVAVLLGGYRLCPGVLVGSFLVNVATGFDASTWSATLRSFEIVVSIGSGAAGQAAVGAALVRRFVGFPNRFSQLSVLAKSLLLAGPVSSLVAATVGVSTLAAHGLVSAESFLGNWLTWWCGDSIGVLLVLPVLQSMSSPQRTGRLSRTLIVSVPLVLATVLTVGLHLHFRQHDEQRVQMEFARRAVVLEDALSHRIQFAMEAARTMQRVLSAAPNLTRSQFDSLARELKSDQPAILALEWIRRVPDANRAAYEASMRREGFPEFQIRERDSRQQFQPTATRRDYFPIHFVSPFEGHEMVDGYDLASDPERNEALWRACDTGEPVATPGRTLLQSRNDTLGVLLIAPLYLSGTPPTTLALRREQLVGFSVSVLHVQSLLETAFDGLNREGCTIRLLDTTDPDRPHPLCPPPMAGDPNVARNTEPPGTRHVATLEMAGRQWTFESTMEPSFLAEHLSLQAWTFLAGGLVLTSLIGLFLLVVTGQNLAVDELVEQRTRELRGANERAEQASRSKSEFLANMSHEIRTPMTAILGFSDILRDSLTHPEQLEAVQTIHRNGHFLLGLINNILDLSKIESGRVELETMPCSPVQVLTDVALLMRGRAADKHLAFQMEFAGPLPCSIHSDPTRLRQILINLVGNALKFTETGSVRVVVQLLDRHAAAPRLQIAVSDTGIGMSAGQRQCLFQPFTQADASMTRKFGGTGLGLSISKRLVEMLGGTIEVASQLGQGTTFTFTVPTGSLDAVEWCDRPLEPLTPAFDASSVSTPPVTVLRHCRILLAEDVPANQRLISFILGKAGADVTVVENGQLAVEQGLSASATDRPFDVILMDMQMPVMDGYVASRQLRQRGYDRPIIALTAHAMSDDRNKCLAAGCSDFATKPIDRQALLHKVAEHFQSEHLRRDSAQGRPGPSSQRLEAFTQEIPDVTDRSRNQAIWDRSPDPSVRTRCPNGPDL